MKFKAAVKKALLKVLVNFFRWRGYGLSKLTSHGELLSFLEKVRPIPIKDKLIRVGGSGDGGYLLPDNLNGISACFSPGVDVTATFETMLAENFKIKSFLADHSVEKAPVQSDFFSFEKKYLGTKNDDIFMRLEDWVNNNSPDCSNDDLILQMDIEGGEYPVILDTPISVLKRFKIMVVEFHSLERLLNRDAFEFINIVFDKVLLEFSVVHIHPNNRCPVVSNSGIDIPVVLEFTFYRNDCVELDNKSLHFPHPLDEKNLSGYDNLILPKCWWPQAT